MSPPNSPDGRGPSWSSKENELRLAGWLTDGPSDSPATVVLAHGAGAPMDSPFLNEIARRLGAAQIRVVRFEFPYMRARRERGERRGPDREPVLRAAWAEVVHGLGGGARLVIGGKSLGGRMASLVADELGVRGLVCLGFPFHAPGKSAAARIGHLAGLRTPTLIVQGTRDALGDRREVASYDLSPKVEIVWVEDGDHSLKPRARSGHTLEESYDEAAAAIVGFVRRLSLPAKG